MSDLTSFNSSSPRVNIMPSPPRPPMSPMLLTASPTLGRRLDSLASVHLQTEQARTPSTSTGVGPSSTSSESEVEWAGSPTRSVRRPASANQTAVADEVVVFQHRPFHRRGAALPYRGVRRGV